MRSTIRISRLFLLAMGYLVAACSDGGPTENRPKVNEIVIGAGGPTLVEGSSRTFTVRLIDAAGRELVGRPVSWSSDAPDIASVSQSGVVNGKKPGTVVISVSSEGVSEAVAIMIVANPEPVALVQLDVTNVPLEEGATRQLVATALDAAGRPVSGRGMQWTSTDDGIAQVGALGLVTGVRTGATTVTVKIDGKTATASVVVAANYAFNLLYDGWSGTAGAPREIYARIIRHPDGGPARVMPNKAAYDVSASPDGTKIVYVVPDGVLSEIYVANIDGSSIKRLTNNDVIDDEPVWSPDGSKIAFRSERGVTMDIWVMNADGSNPVDVTPDPLPGTSREGRPTWSPDASRIAFVSDLDTYPRTRIWTVRVDGTDRRRITPVSTSVDDQPSWSPDGQTIAFQRTDAAIFGDIYLVNATGGNERKLMPFYDLPGPQLAPAWSPDGKLIAFASKHETYGSGTGVYQIYTVWADGSKLARRTSDDVDKQNPTWIKE
jgi:dipeptidyl aminopeptidase/acylaminoacyl peptidase